MAKSLPSEDGEVSLVDKAYDHVKTQILTMVYRPGQLLSEPKIAEELGISRTPVREAIRRLMSEGLVNWIPGQGKVVYILSLKDLEEIFEVKESLEALAAGAAAANRTDEDAKELQQISAEMEAAAVVGDVKAWLDADTRYHDLVFDLSGKPRVRQIIANLNEQWHRLRLGLVALELRMLVSVQEHRRVTEAIVAGDREAAATAMADHLKSLQSTVMSLAKNLLIPYVGENL
ncbi:MAG TPA: GntR family transcriptional regulator [Symbiobacteriaceae bacterium]|nr:GntR family transcriptional regulator [Symbiobacteriaceae bacterium]